MASLLALAAEESSSSLAMTKKRKLDGHSLMEPDRDFSSLEEENEYLWEENDRLRQKLNAIQPAKEKRIVSKVATISDENTDIRTWSLKRMASISTKEELDKQEQISAQNTPRMISPSSHLIDTIIAETRSHESWTCSFVSDPDFVTNFLVICRQVCIILKAEQRVLQLQSPCYVLGDIHGNLDDLRFFGTKLWPLGMDLSGSTSLFMGDYVDRGFRGLEVVAYLFARKVRNPNKLFMLRGNHETVEINTWTEQYKSRSFLQQCWKLFGRNDGTRLCFAINYAFQHLPFAAVIDDSIFCVHGGIPPSEKELPGTRIDQINTIPCPIRVTSPALYNYDSEDDDLANSTLYDDEEDEAGIEHKPVDLSSLPSTGFEDEGAVAPTPDAKESKDLMKYYQRIAFNCLWADPATEEQESLLIAEGQEFMQGRRGEFSVAYGWNAIDAFLKETNLKLVMRAHEASVRGVRICKHAKVMTVFSTSKDHGVNPETAACACVLVDRDTISVINKSSAAEVEAEKRMLLKCSEDLTTDFDFLGDDDDADSVE